MKTFKLALGSFVVGAVLSIAPIGAYAACSEQIWVQDGSDCHIYNMYSLVGSNCGGDVCVCAYAQDGGCYHYESGPCV
jgi:hypothetical protein